jgi:hypothetical protein
MLNIIKKLVSILLVCMMVTLHSSPVKAQVNQLELKDVALASYHYLHSKDKEDNLWPDQPEIEDFVPMYGIDDEVSCYYIQYKSGEYAVINNNPSNPCALEYGSNNQQLRSILDKNSKVYYLGPLSVVPEKEFLENKGYYCDKYTINPYLQEANPVLEKYMEENRNKIQIVRSGSGWGFVAGSDLSGSGYSYHYLPGLSGITWATTSIVTDQNNCAPTCATNVVQYFASRGYSCANASLSLTYSEVNLHVYNPSSDIGPGLQSYFNAKQLSLYYSTPGSFSSYQSAVNANRPVGICVWNGPTNGHWILGVGYRVYSSSEQYARIVRGWENSSNYYYLYGSLTQSKVEAYYIY